MLHTGRPAQQVRQGKWRCAGAHSSMHALAQHAHRAPWHALLHATAARTHLRGMRAITGNSQHRVLTTGTKRAGLEGSSSSLAFTPSSLALILSATLAQYCACITRAHSWCMSPPQAATQATEPDQVGERACRGYHL